MKLKLHYIAGINGDRLEVSYDNVKINHAFGYTCSSSRANERYAEKNHYDAIKYKWNTIYPLKPYIGDLIKDIVETNYINAEDIEYSGYNVFAGREMTKEEVKETFDRLFAEI